MRKNVKYSEAIKFFSVTKSRKEFGERFNLSPIESWHYIKGMIKRNDLEKIKLTTGRVGRSFGYRALTAEDNYGKEESVCIDANEGYSFSSDHGVYSSGVLVLG